MDMPVDWCISQLNSHQRSFFLQGVASNTETHNWQKCREQETMSLNGTFLSYLLLPRPRDHCRTGVREIVGTWDAEWPRWNSLLQTKHGRCTQSLTVIVTACTRPGQSQVRQYPTMAWGSGQESPVLVEQLLVTGSFSKRQSQFAIRFWCWVGWAVSRR